jgi:predicted transcriptional regulator
MDNLETLEQVTSIVEAYLRHNRMPASGISELIASVDASIRRLNQPAVEAPAPKQPAVNPKRSVFADHIVCLEDGKKFKSLKRHLSVHHGLTPAEYRSKWGLDAEYPMVAPNYAATRSELAKSLGLGRKKAPEPVPAKGRGRKPRAAKAG